MGSKPRSSNININIDIGSNNRNIHICDRNRALKIGDSNIGIHFARECIDVEVRNHNTSIWWDYANFSSVRDFNENIKVTLTSLKTQDTNKNIDVDILLNDLTQGEKKLIVSQKYLTQIKNGDTRVIIYNGIVHEKVLIRFPPKNDFRANLAYGGKYVIRSLPVKHKKYLSEIAEFLKMNRIYLAGVDMIGDFITEINITSPTGIQEIERECNNNLSKDIANELINITQSFYNHDY